MPGCSPNLEEFIADKRSNKPVHSDAPATKEANRMEQEIDYSRYTIAQLLDIKRNIKPELAPTNYKNLLIALESRKDEIDAYFKQEVAEKKKTRVKLIVILGWSQLLSAAILLVLLVVRFINVPDGQSVTLYGFIIWMIPFGLNGFAGYLSVKGKLVGYWLSIINQAMQLILLNIGGWVYSYSGVGGIYAYLSHDYSLGINAMTNPGFRIKIAGSLEPNYVAIDLLALLFIVVIAVAIKDKRTSNS